ncbi:hypothetical protein THRCLA_04329 [Thraustotheca clavata]|uniref:Ig-like domain-containing protein n=1 Tax=Thraustotheca clavata TaxID=74557 RepID=A0A1W0A023_9STRA|nr:hypothetical protein THRCLA_04329 [Thraustotheca clavata]
MLYKILQDLAWRGAAIRAKWERDQARLKEKERDVISETRMDLVQKMYEEYPERVKGIDRQKRTVLHGAVIGNWTIEAIAWLIEKFPDATGIKDCDGFTPITYGVLYGRCDEIILQMAIPVAKTAYDEAKKMYDINNFEGCKRIFNKTTQDVLSGVPNFDHCHIHAALELDTKSACDEIFEYWSDFISKWGYFDPPHLIEDLVPKKRVILGSHASLTIVAKGEPLSYQWYCDGDILNGCTQATLDITQRAQVEDEGEYYCRVTNWRGSVNSTTTTIFVIDDTIVVDPSTRYYYPKEKLLPNESLFTVKAATGAVLMCDGIQLLIPPNSFQVLDLFDCNLAETTGMDIVMLIDSQPYDNIHLPKLSPIDEWFISPLVSLKPTKLDPFLTPWTCRIPHSSMTFMTLDRTGLEIAVLQITPIDMGGNFAYSDVPMYQCRVSDTFIDIDLLELGTFVVIQRRCSHDDAITKQRMLITLAMQKDLEIKLNSTIDIYAWICPTRLDCVDKITSILASETNLTLLTTLAIEVTGQMELSMRLNRDVVNEQLKIGCMKSLGVIRLQVSPKLFQQNYNSIVAELEIALHRECQATSRVRLGEHNKYSVQISWSSQAQQHPSYVIVELAPFSKTFWDRYKDIWWFERLYQVAHKEITGGNSATIYTDVHAAAIRVAIFNQDHTTTYSDPVLLIPETLHDNEEEIEVKSNGLVSRHISTQLHSDHSYVIALISLVYTNSRVFTELFGVSPENVILLLDLNKAKIRSCHYATALLLAGLINLDKMATNVPFHKPVCVFFTKLFGLLERYIPALDISYDNETTRTLVQRLHCTLRDLFVAVREFGN